MFPSRLDGGIAPTQQNACGARNGHTMEGTMRKALAVIVIGTGLTIFSSAAFAASTDTKTTAQAQSTTEKKAPVKHARHSTVGVVKSIDASTMVIARSGKNSGDMTFQVSSSTHRQGT